MSKLTYAKAGGPPKNWPDLEVVERLKVDDVRVMADVLEVDCKVGFCTRYVRKDGKLLVDGGSLVTETVKGKFEIRERGK